jgi:hypothetical protein
MNEKNKQNLNTVHEMDLQRLLGSLGISDDFQNGKILCKFCKKTITKDNIYSLFRESGSISFVCDEPSCITQSLIYLEERKKTIKNDE